MIKVKTNPPLPLPPPHLHLLLHSLEVCVVLAYICQVELGHVDEEAPHKVWGLHHLIEGALHPHPGVLGGRPHRVRVEVGTAAHHGHLVT